MPPITLNMNNYMALLEAERKLGELDLELDKAKESGVPVGNLPEIRQMMGEQIASLKKNYTPSAATKLQNSQV